MLINILTQFLRKIKDFFRLNKIELGVSCIIVFVGISAFFLGKYSVLKAQDSVSNLSIENSDKDTSSPSPESSSQVQAMDESDTRKSDGQVIASKNGKKYYFPWCSGVDRISAKNKIYFKTADDAKNAGLTVSSTCKGLD